LDLVVQEQLAEHGQILDTVTNLLDLAKQLNLVVVANHQTILHQLITEQIVVWPTVAAEVVDQLDITDHKVLVLAQV
jgi:hypothetical protein